MPSEIMNFNGKEGGVLPHLPRSKSISWNHRNIFNEPQNKLSTNETKQLRDICISYTCTDSTDKGRSYNTILELRLELANRFT
jgi:hypothetical protein